MNANKNTQEKKAVQTTIDAQAKRIAELEQQIALNRASRKQSIKVVSFKSDKKARENEKLASHMHVSVSSDASTMLMQSESDYVLEKYEVENVTYIVVKDEIRDVLTQATDEAIKKLCE